MKNLIIKEDYMNPNNNNIEIIERKGLGHPDSLADKLAEECSRVYSEYCMENFGCVLHHNFDKLYIGAGCFRYENGKVNMLQPVKVYLNGRASNTMNGQAIDLEALLKPVIKKYISHIMPRIDVEKELNIFINCTQNTKINNWFSPRDINDVPDAKNVFANDTSLCVAHYPFTFCENLVMETEQFFWNYVEDTYPTPKFDDIGQDIKVMLSRLNNDITLSLCIPVYMDKFNNREEYISIIQKYEKLLIDKISTIDNPYGYNIKIEINKMANGDYLTYTLCKGSCIECGEEGIVGRGNNSQGIIPAFRHHTMEAPSGKNERYHTGRVLSFLANRTVKRIYEECGVSCSMYCLTKNKNNLLDPFLMYLSVDNYDKIEEIETIIEEEFNEKTYLPKILKRKKLY